MFSVDLVKHGVITLSVRCGAREMTVIIIIIIKLPYVAMGNIFYISMVKIP